VELTDWTLLSVGALTFIVLAAKPCARSTNQDSTCRARNQPAFAEFKGVRLGMTADEARKKLGRSAR